MSLATTHCHAALGIEAPLVSVETHLANGLPQPGVAVAWRHNLPLTGQFHSSTSNVVDKQQTQQCEDLNKHNRNQKHYHVTLLKTDQRKTTCKLQQKSVKKHTEQITTLPAKLK